MFGRLVATHAWRCGLSVILIAFVLGDQPARAQTLSSGSTGADGAFHPVGVGTMNAGHGSGRATEMSDGKVLITGGYVSRVAEVYDPLTGRFNSTGLLSVARASHSATRLANGKILVAGGYNGGYLDTAELYDPVTGQFSATGTMPAARYEHTATLLLDGRVLIAGGHISGEQPLGAALLYDHATGAFAPTAGSMLTGRRYHSATLLSNGKVLIAGGTGVSGRVTSAELFDPATGSFRAVPGTLSSPREWHTATLLPSGLVLIAGGLSSSEFLSSAELYDPSTELFSPTAQMNTVRALHTATLLSESTGRVLITGGRTGPPFSSAEVYDPATGLFTVTDSMRSGRFEHLAARTPGGRVLVAGGYSSSGGQGNGIQPTSADVYDSATGLFSTFVFNPRAFTPPLDPDGDNIFHFSSITIPAGITVRLSGDAVNGPVYWLASGAVTIDGTLDLSGGSGHAPDTKSASARGPSIPGPGGFGGGAGGNSVSPARPGNGPKGGEPSPTANIRAGGFSGNSFLVPLVGGSGGAGGVVSGTTSWGGGGGAGAGAILIASSVSISVNGTVRADGGVASDTPCDARATGGGAGGGIRLAAPVISGSGSLSVQGGTGGCSATGAAGRVRLEAFDDRFAGTGTVTRGSPYALFVPTSPPPSVRVTSVAGKPVSSTPSGSFTLPDVQINEGTSVPVTIEAHQIPQGTVVELHLFSENGGDQVVSFPALAGSLETTTTTFNVTFPAGFTRGFPKAKWQ